jgi:hypothetical protein
MKKYLLALSLLVGVMSAGVTTRAEGVVSFSDTTGHWAAKSIQGAVFKGYVDGYQDGTFRPEENITRAEFVKMVVDSLKFKTDPVDEKSKWYANYMKTALENGLTVDGEYSNEQLDEKMTRLEMSKVVVRGTGEYNTDDLKWMYLATSKGLVNGMDNQGGLGLNELTTRAQAVTIIERLLAIKDGTMAQIKPDPFAKYAISAAEILWHRTNAYTMAPEYFGDAKKRNEPFYWDKTRVETELGYSEIEKYIVVDMGDPLDPNRKLIPENMVWNMQVGKTNTFTKDVPLNSYAFLSFNHFVRYNADKPTTLFRFAYLSMSSFDLYTYDNVDEKGNLIQITFYGPYVEKAQSMTVGSMQLDAGQSEVNVVTAQLGPKNPPLKLSSNQTSVYKMAAVELGDTLSRVVLSSVYKPLPKEGEQK